MLKSRTMSNSLRAETQDRRLSNSLKKSGVMAVLDIEFGSRGRGQSITVKTAALRRSKAKKPMPYQVSVMKKTSMMQQIHHPVNFLIERSNIKEIEKVETALF